MSFRLITWNDKIYLSDKSDIYEAIVEVIDNGIDSSEIIAIIPSDY